MVRRFLAFLKQEGINSQKRKRETVRMCPGTAVKTGNFQPNISDIGSFR
jgi:hypothetical protein